MGTGGLFIGPPPRMRISNVGLGLQAGAPGSPVAA